MTLDWIAGGPTDREGPEAPAREPRRVQRMPEGTLRNPPPPEGTTGAADQWVPVGPAAVLRGQATRRPRISGRVRALQVSDDGQRAYAGTAQGGTWYTGDGGRQWLPLDFYATTLDLDGHLGEANALAVGALGVRFGPAADGSQDVVYVGTGEARSRGYGARPDRTQGVGIRQAARPAKAVADNGPAHDPWTLEATNIAGESVYRLAFDDRDGVVWAATTDGLYRRPPSSRAEWEQVDTGLGDGEVSDVVVTRGEPGEPRRIYAALRTGRLAWSVSGDAGDWTEVALPPYPPHVPPAALPAIVRMALAEGNTPGRAVVYVLASGPRLWRVEAGAAAVVGGLDPGLFKSGDSGQDEYDMAIAVHPSAAPADRDRIALAGAAVLDGEWNGALHVGRATQAASGAWTFGPVAPATATYAGSGVHPDLHAVEWVPGAGSPEMWVACDGGVFRSQADGAPGTFAPRNDGIASLEGTFLAQHPDTDGLVLVGTQDNGAIRQMAGETFAVVSLGDAGGVAIDPRDPRRMLAQYVETSWESSRDGGLTFSSVSLLHPPASTATAAEVTAWTTLQADEKKVSAFYSGAAAIAAGGVTQLAIGTDRPWYSEDWGRTWRTLPTGTDPYDPATAGAPLRDQDRLPERAAINVVRWASPTRLLVMTLDGIHLLVRDAAGAWERHRLYDRQAAVRNWKGKTPSGQIPFETPLTDLAVHDPARGTRGSLYAATSGVGEEHVWWFDGSEDWQEAGLTVDSPVHALAVDPVNPGTVYVGTDVGVFRGVGTFPADGDDPSWVWTHLSDGLPEAAVVDLAVHGRRLLRAALRGRGVWELPLDGVEQRPEAYLCAHLYDTRRLAIPAGGEPDPLGDPALAPRAVLPLDASPDVRVHRAPGAAPPPAPAAFPASRSFSLWVLQTALRVAGQPLAVSGISDAATHAAFGARKAELGLPVMPDFDAAVWNAIVGGADANRLPFASDPPTAFDVHEHLRDEPDTRADPGTASCTTEATATHPALVRVIVHGRDWRELEADRVVVALLRAPFNGAPGLEGMPALPGGWAAALRADTGSAPNAAGAFLAGSDWSLADAATPYRRPGRAIDPRQPQVVTFACDLSAPAWPAGGWLLLAVVHAEDDPLVATETDLRVLVRTSRHVAARSVRRFAP